MSPAGAHAASRVLLVGSDADVSISLHLHLERAGYALYCLPAPGEMEAMLRAIAPHVVVLILPATPDASWENALTTAASAARRFVRVVVVAPSREMIEPLAAVAGAEQALARAEVLSHPLAVVDRVGARATTGAPLPAPTAAQPAPSLPPPVLGERTAPASPTRPRPAVDLMALIDEELVEEPHRRMQPMRVDVNVSLVSAHNFFVGPTRRVDSGGVFVASAMPPPVGTRVQIRLGLPDGRKLELAGEVVYQNVATAGSQPTGCGVRLFNLPGWAIYAIDRFLQARQPILYAPPG